VTLGGSTVRKLTRSHLASCCLDIIPLVGSLCHLLLLAGLTPTVVSALRALWTLPQPSARENSQVFLTVGHYTCNLPHYIFSFSIFVFVTSIVAGNNVTFANEQLYKLVPNLPKIPNVKFFNVDCSESQSIFTKTLTHSPESTYLYNTSAPSFQNEFTIAMSCCPNTVTCCTAARNNRLLFWLNIPRCVLCLKIRKFMHGSKTNNRLPVFLTDRPIICSRNFDINYDSDYDCESVMHSYVNSITLSPSTVETNFCISHITVYIPTPITSGVFTIISVLICYP
jgi:hypothetical protein